MGIKLVFVDGTYGRGNGGNAGAMRDATIAQNKALVIVPARHVYSSRGVWSGWLRQGGGLYCAVHINYMAFLDDWRAGHWCDGASFRRH
eukprot:scaffold49510_cov37-Cyclotella_meneghiniana.AAC.1